MTPEEKSLDLDLTFPIEEQAMTNFINLGKLILDVCELAETIVTCDDTCSIDLVDGIQAVIK